MYWVGGMVWEKMSIDRQYANDPLLQSFVPRSELGIRGVLLDRLFRMGGDERSVPFCETNPNCMIYQTAFILRSDKVLCDKNEPSNSGSFSENEPSSVLLKPRQTVENGKEIGSYTLRLTIAEADGSIVAQSCQGWVGDVAQLVERRNGIAEATGSTPVVSTNLLFGDLERTCKSLAFFGNSATLTRLRRRTALLGQKEHEQQD
jgi:hypothetical protein